METQILVVDDNPDIIASVRAVFEAASADFTVIGADSGLEAILSMRRQRPSVVLLDIMMPDMSGWEVASAMKDDVALADIPIIYLTAKADELSRQMGSLSSDDYVVKPFRAEDLIRRVKNVVVRAEYLKGKANLLR